MPLPDFKIRLLEAADNRNAFECPSEPLNRYLQKTGFARRKTESRYLFCRGYIRRSNSWILYIGRNRSCLK